MITLKEAIHRDWPAIIVSAILMSVLAIILFLLTANNRLIVELRQEVQTLRTELENLRLERYSRIQQQQTPNP